MAVTSDIVRWVNTSLIKYFTDIADANSITMFVEGIDERSESTMQENHAELRLQGPFVKKLSHSVWSITSEVNILLTIRMQMASQNAYLLEEQGGIFISAMDARIPVYRYGDGDTLLGCLRVKLDRSHEIQFFNFGTLENNTRVRQGAIDATFEMTTGE